MPVWQKAASERTADLARYAQRAAVGLRDIDAFDFVRRAAVLAGKTKQPLARAVDRNLLGGDVEPVEREPRLQRRPQILRQGRHLVEALHAAHIEPVPDLLHPHAPLPLRHIGRAERLAPRRRATARPATAVPAPDSVRADASRRKAAERFRFRRCQRSSHRQSKSRQGSRHSSRYGSRQALCRNACGIDGASIALFDIRPERRSLGSGRHRVYSRSYLHSWPVRSRACARPLRL